MIRKDLLLPPITYESADISTLFDFLAQQLKADSYVATIASFARMMEEHAPANGIAERKARAVQVRAVLGSVRNSD